MKTPSLDSHVVFTRAATYQEVASYLDVTPQFLEKAALRGELRVRRMGPKTIRILPEDLLAFLEAAATPPVKPNHKPTLAICD